jgi:hypothetical protein
MSKASEMHRPLWVLFVLGGCSQSNGQVSTADAPSHVLRIEEVEILSPGLGTSAFIGTELRLDAVVEGDRVVAMLVAPWGEPAVYEGDAAASRLRLGVPPGGSALVLHTDGPLGPEQLGIHAVVLDGHVEDGRLHLGGVELEGDESVTSRWPEWTSQVRAAATARPDDIPPSGELGARETMLGGILPWQRVTLRLSEPIDPASLDQVTGSDPLAIETTVVRGQVARAAIGPVAWWSEAPTVSFPAGIADRIPNAGSVPSASFERIPDIAPSASFDFEDGEGEILRASTGDVFLASDLGCHGGSAGCLAFGHPRSHWGSGEQPRSELFARLEGTLSGIRFWVRVLEEASDPGAVPARTEVWVYAAPDGVGEETAVISDVRTMPLDTAVGPFVGDSGWQEMRLSFPAPVDGAGVFVRLVTRVSAPPGSSPPSGGAPAAPVAASTVLVDDLGAI